MWLLEKRVKIRLRLNVMTSCENGACTPTVGNRKPGRKTSSTRLIKGGKRDEKKGRKEGRE